jgi:hypothetical protein
MSRLDDLAGTIDDIENDDISFRQDGYCETIINGELSSRVSVRTHDDTEFVTIRIGDSLEILVTKTQYPKFVSILSSFLNKNIPAGTKKSLIKG